MEIKNFKTPADLAEYVSYGLLTKTLKKIEVNEKLYLAVSGGSTPKILFEMLSEEPFRSKILWNFIHIFWVDERCVPPDSAESNFGNADRLLLKNVNIPPENIHRIKGEANPEEEIFRYSADIEMNVNKINGLPSFDWILLGMGEDGHTASIFPGTKLKQTANDICAWSVHPQSMQNRITLTEEIINNASIVTFLITGKEKAVVLNNILENRKEALNYPAARIHPASGRLEWFISV